MLFLLCYFYYSILLILLGQDTKWLSVSIIILLISYYLGYYETFTSVKNNNGCVKPTEDNPFIADKGELADYYLRKS